MKVITSKNLFLLSVLIIACFGCSAIDSFKKSVEKNGSPTSETNTANGSTPAGNSSETVSVACANKYAPVKDGKTMNYKMSLGGNDAKIVQQYTDGAANFTEVMTIGAITVTHSWECTSEGLIAANPGSGLDSQTMKLVPKYVSGVTLPKDDEMRVGKTWTTVYTETGTSPLGDVSANLTLNNKVTAVDEEVTVPAGTFKTVKVEINLELTDMKMGKTVVPKINVKSYAWFAPGVGMVKSEANTAAFGVSGNSKMELKTDN